jgi:hypothetical protein
VLLSGVGVTLVFLLTGKDDGPADNPAAAATAASSSSSSSTAPATSSSEHSHDSAAGDLPGGARVA